MAAVTTALVEELQGAVSGGSAERRVQMLQKITDLFLSQAAHLNEQHIGVFDGVLLHLMDHAEAPALAAFSGSIAGSKAAPREVIRALACHEDTSIAAPALSRSSRLTDGDLVDIAGTRGQQHLLAISGRKTLGKAVTDILLERGDAAVSRALAKNAGASFSDFGYKNLVERSEHDERLAHAVGVRSDLPPNVLQELLLHASEAVRSQLLETPRLATRRRIQASMRGIAERSRVPDAGPPDYAKATTTAAALNRAGQLNDQTINRFAVRGEYVSVIAGLAMITKVPIETIEPLIYRDTSDGLIVACRAARLDWQTAAAIIRHRPNCPEVSQQDLVQARKIFEMLAVSTAQQALHIWSNRNAAKKADAGA
jgi:uncharacterized protein (DUF2336 family)